MEEEDDKEDSEELQRHNQTEQFQQTSCSLGGQFLGGKILIDELIQNAISRTPRQDIESGSELGAILRRRGLEDSRDFFSLHARRENSDLLYDFDGQQSDKTDSLSFPFDNIPGLHNPFKKPADELENISQISNSLGDKPLFPDDNSHNNSQSVFSRYCENAYNEKRDTVQSFQTDGTRSQRKSQISLNNKKTLVSLRLQQSEHRKLNATSNSNSNSNSQSRIFGDKLQNSLLIKEYSPTVQEDETQKEKGDTSYRADSPYSRRKRNNQLNCSSPFNSKFNKDISAQENGLKNMNSITQDNKIPNLMLSKILSNFKKMEIVRRFIKKMLQLSQQHYWKYLKQQHSQIIGDITTSKGLNFSNSSSGLSSQIPFLERFSIKPNDRFSLVWEIFEIVFLFYHVIAFGFRFAFNIPLNNYIQMFSIVFYLLDLLIIINTGYYSGIEIVTNKLKIIKFNSFNISMCIISLCALFFSDQGPVQFVFIFRLKQLYRSYNHFEANFSIRQRFPISATLIHLLLITILLAHYNACAYYFFSANFSDPQQSWLTSLQLKDTDWYHTYIVALYFSFITMVTVGYGDVVPKSTGERVYTIIFVLISAITFAYVVNTIGALFQDMSKQEGKFVQKKYDIVNYMEQRNISKSIQISVIKFLEYTISEEKELQNSVEGETFLQSIPLKLRQQVYSEYYGRVLREIKMFNLNFTNEFLLELSIFMKEKTLGPGEEIFKQGEDNDTFFIINRGQVEFEVELQNKQVLCLGILKKGDAFNHSGLFRDVTQEMTARCQKITQIIYLSKADFLSVLQQNKSEHEKYCMIREKLMMGSQELGDKCISCDEYQHSVMTCRLLSYNPSKAILIAKAQYSESILNRDSEYIRDMNKSINALGSNVEVKQSLKYLRHELAVGLLGQHQQPDIFGSFTDLIEQNISDEAFFSQYPQIVFNPVEQMIKLKSYEDLELTQEQVSNSPLENGNSTPRGGHRASQYQQQQQLQQLRRDSIQLQQQMPQQYFGNSSSATGFQQRSVHKNDQQLIEEEMGNSQTYSITGINNPSYRRISQHQAQLQQFSKTFTREDCNPMNGQPPSNNKVNESSSLTSADEHSISQKKGENLNTLHQDSGVLSATPNNKASGIISSFGKETDSRRPSLLSQFPSFVHQQSLQSQLQQQQQQMPSPSQKLNIQQMNQNNNNASLSQNQLCPEQLQQPSHPFKSSSNYRRLSKPSILNQNVMINRPSMTFSSEVQQHTSNNTAYQQNNNINSAAGGGTSQQQGLIHNNRIDMGLDITTQTYNLLQQLFNSLNGNILRKNSRQVTTQILNSNNFNPFRQNLQTASFNPINTATAHYSGSQNLINKEKPNNYNPLGGITLVPFIMDDFEILREYDFFFPSMNFSAVKVVYNAYSETLRKKHNLIPFSVPRKKKIQNDASKDFLDSQHILHIQHKSNNNFYKENSFTNNNNNYCRDNP